MKNKKLSNIFIYAGIFLLLTAASVTCFNLFSEYRAGKSADKAADLLIRQIFSLSPANGEYEPADYILNPDMEMPSVEIEGNDYIGILEIPRLEITLPIMSEWDAYKLTAAPCRYKGTAYKGNFVIAGHNYRTHFGHLKKLSEGEQVKFTDVKGREFLYEVKSVEILEPAAVEDMISDAWDLTLFTCTIGGKTRVTVRCLKL